MSVPDPAPTGDSAAVVSRRAAVLLVVAGLIPVIALTVGIATGWWDGGRNCSTWTTGWVDQYTCADDRPPGWWNLLWLTSLLWVPLTVAMLTVGGRTFAGHPPISKRAFGWALIGSGVGTGLLLAVAFTVNMAVGSGDCHVLLFGAGTAGSQWVTGVPCHAYGQIIRGAILTAAIGLLWIPAATILGGVTLKRNPRPEGTP